MMKTLEGSQATSTETVGGIAGVVPSVEMADLRVLPAAHVGSFQAAVDTVQTMEDLQFSK